MKVLFIISLVLFLTSCSKTEGLPWSVGEVCIKGVTYYSSGYRLAAAFSPDSKVIPCSNEDLL